MKQNILIWVFSLFASVVLTAALMYTVHELNKHFK